MENKITVAKLAAMLALATGKQKKLCDDFLREFFSLVEEQLTEGENVRIKGFGTFKLVDVEPRKSVNVATGEDTTIPGHTKVLFVAAKELAALVNSPFEAFEAVEVADDLPTDMLDGEGFSDEISEVLDNEESGKRESEDEPSDVVLKTESDVEMADDIATADAYGMNGGEPEKENTVSREETADCAGGSHMEVAADHEEELEHMSLEMDPEDVSRGEAYNDAEVEEERPGHRFAWGFLSGFLCASLIAGVVFICAHFMGYSFGLTGAVATDSDDVASSPAPEAVMNVPGDDKGDAVAIDSDITPDSRQEMVKVEEKIDKDGGDDVPTKASDEPVYDVVTTTRYLTTIAKEHYGNFNLWPIIYEENKDFLGHPDRIRPGTKVVVPPLSKYGVDPKNPDQVKEIKRKGVEIYSRFKT